MSEANQDKYPFGPPGKYAKTEENIKVPGVARIEGVKDGANLLGIMRKVADDARTRAARLDGLMQEYDKILKRANAGESVQDEFDRWLQEVRELLMSES